jgi:hypothetical protein
MAAHDILMGAAGAVTATPGAYIEDVFSTYLYTGNGAENGISNGIELGPDTGNSTYFNTGQINTNSSSSAFDLGTSNWTIECWFKATASTRMDPFEINNGPGNAGFFGLTINRAETGQIEWNEASGSTANPVISATGTAIVNGSWHHVAITRSGNSVRLFLDGAQIGSYTTSYTYGAANKEFRFGNRWPGGVSGSSTFFISNFRIVKGNALYTSGFTPPISSLTLISGTSYLAHQSMSSLIDTTSVGNGYTGGVTTLGTGPFNFGAGKGGLVWIARRNNADNHMLVDTTRGVQKYINTNTGLAESVDTSGVTAFNSSGFTVGGNSSYNASGFLYSSWTFRKQAKFFDIVTYTGNGVAGRQIAHNLGSAPGFMMIKRLSGGGMLAYHRSIPISQYLEVGSTSSGNSYNLFNNTHPTSTHFTVASDSSVNANGYSYVAYLFAHDAGGFGNTGNDNVITCGTFTTDASGSSTVSLGYEPQWLLIKRSDGGSSSWWMLDSMRGWNVTNGLSNGTILQMANSTTSEIGPYQGVDLGPSGFRTFGGYIDGSAQYIFVAIRRGPMRTPTSGTSVFDAEAYTGDGGVSRLITSGFTVDAAFITDRTDATYGQRFISDRIRGGGISLATNTDLAEGADTGYTNSDMKNQFQSNVGIQVTTFASRYNNSSKSYIAYMFRRAPKFFDVVPYTGNGATGARLIQHNLTTAPELMIVKYANGTAPAGNDWYAYSAGLTSPTTQFLRLNTIGGQATSTIWGSTAPTSINFSIATTTLNANGTNYIAYLFASCPGVSKVGTYTGNGSSLTVDCGFSTGARFVLIKRIDTSQNWIIFDTARGIVAGADPFLAPNITTAETTGLDAIDPVASGFIINNVSGGGNINNGKYIYLAIA